MLLHSLNFRGLFRKTHLGKLPKKAAVSAAMGPVSSRGFV
jgi:hypothetical protein